MAIDLNQVYQGFNAAGWSKDYANSVLFSASNLLTKADALATDDNQATTVLRLFGAGGVGGADARQRAFAALAAANDQVNAGSDPVSASTRQVVQHAVANAITEVNAVQVGDEGIAADQAQMLVDVKDNAVALPGQALGFLGDLGVIAIVLLVIAGLLFLRVV